MKIKRILGKKLYDFLYRHYITYSLKRTISCIREKRQGFGPDAAVDFLFSSYARHIKPMQHKEELVQLARKIHARKPQTVLEIGTARGGTLFMAAQLAADNALVISIDLPGGIYGGGYPDWKIPLYGSLGKPAQTIHLIQGDSHSQEVMEKLKTALNGRTIDYLFIDGDHTYEGVKQDFENYSTLLSHNGIVAFHDIVTDRSETPNHFVHEYWNEIKNRYHSEEYVRDPLQSKLGIGVLTIN